MELAEYFKRLLNVCLVCLVATAVIACGREQQGTEKLRDLEFTIIAKDNMPQELLETVEMKKEQPFKMTLEDRGFLYICIGYGTQQTGGYSISVKEVYETSNAIYVDTELIGPQPGEKSKSVASYPYIVIKLEKVDKPVVFA